MNKQDQQNLRLMVCQVLLESLPDDKNDFHQQSLQVLFPKHLSTLHPQSRALATNICYGVFRYYFLLMALLAEFLKKPLKNKDKDILCILLAASYELLFLNTPEHAIISESVNISEKLGKGWAKGLVNAVLRNIQRSAFTPENLKDHLKQNNNYNDEVAFNHPQWLIDCLQKDWPENFRGVLEANALRAPMTLRVNRQRCSQVSYLEQLEEKGLNARASLNTEYCLYLEEAVDVHELPGFKEGCVSVQDEAAQQAAKLLGLQAGQRVLDACAAPGGKSSHMLELEPNIELTCLDLNAQRLEKVITNFSRMEQKANCLHANAAYPEQWWDGVLFDRILLDAPCTASGIIRRNPDIKLQRRPEDIQRMAAQQLLLIEALWPCLKTDGLILYATCSVFKEENEMLVSEFLQKESSAVLDEFDLALGIKRPFGQQLFPQQNSHDGFFYARLKKL